MPRLSAVGISGLWDGEDVNEINSTFEGGDLIKDDLGRVFIGNGFRTDKVAYNEIKGFFNKEVYSLNLIDPLFFHLNLAFLPIDSDTIMYIPKAFDYESQLIINDCFNNKIQLTPMQGLSFACNSIITDMNIFAPSSAQEVMDKYFFKDHITYFNTSEFQKAGGSLASMTLVQP